MAEKPLSADFQSLSQLLYAVSAIGVATLAGYPACCLIFPTRRWNVYSKWEKKIFSGAVGCGYLVLGWIFITNVGNLLPQYSTRIKGNETILVIALLSVVAMCEVFLMALLIPIRRYLRKRK